MPDPLREEDYGRASRWLLRGSRAIRWTLKGLVRARWHIVVDVRWRLGDEIMAIPIYEGLRPRNANVRISVLCHYPELLELNPFVDAVNDVRGGVDRWISLRSGPRDVHRIEHYARCAGIPTPLDRPRLYYLDWSAPVLEELPKRFVAVCPGASWATKRWPIDRWRDLCQAIEALGWPVVELGREDESIQAGISLMDKTSIREAACVLHAAKLLICCDSGLMHLALAAGTPALALFGPTDPGILIREDARLSVIKNPDPCRGCWNSAQTAAPPGVCPLDRPACLDTISVSEVLARTRELLHIPHNRRRLSSGRNAS